MARVITVARSDEVAPGTGRVVELEDRALAVFNLDGEFYVMDNSCLHRGGPLGEGILEGRRVTCPWHGWEYDVSTGKNILNPGLKVRTYRVCGHDGEIKVEL